MKFLIENSFDTTLEDFIIENTSEDVETITIDDIKLLINLKIGESCYIGIVEIKRIL